MNSDRNDPGRFFGDGVTFKAKLIGILEVGEARGDRMCQEALQDLKMAIRAAGEHKQRITIHVTIDGLRLRDEKTSDSLYHHPVHKISFIAQDMTDSRAFGYIFGSPDSGHRFFGIKTDKAASQVVLAMRDLFQVVFELKKKEIEMARQQIQSKIVLEPNIPSKVKSTGTDPMNTLLKNACEAEKSNPKEASPESVADLVDLEQELSSIQRGITQMERITPNEPSATTKILTNEDPFGESFTIYQLLPPPEPSRSRYLRVNKSSEINLSEINSVCTNEDTSTSTVEQLGSEFDKKEVTPSFAEPHLSMATKSSTKIHTHEENSPPQCNDEFSSSFLNASTSSDTFPKMSFIDAFSDLDPLGTGKSKPYVDKKYFFQDLKNPPKKVLKDLSQKDIFSATFQKCESGLSDALELEGNFENQYSESSIEKPNFSEDTATKISQSSEKPFKIELNGSKITGPIMVKRDTDPFSPTRKKSDPFQEGNIFPNLDSCELRFGDNEQPVFVDKNISSVEAETIKNDNVFNGPLQVNLPSENLNPNIQKKMEKQPNESPLSSGRTRPSVFKQNTVDVISSISSKKMPHLFVQKFSKRDSNNINMRRLQESDSFSENESAPEPPPRPDSSSQVEPPPLPPKKQFTDIVIRPQITSSSANQPPVKYDYLTTNKRYTTDQSSEIAPPIPLPSRKIVRTDSNFSYPLRSGRNPSEEDDYLAPISNYQDVPPLLPPPQSKSRIRKHDNIEKKTHKEMLSSNIEPTTSKTILPDITLSQLLTLGIDEIASKLNVPTSKLNTMTLVELTACLSNFLENTKHVQKQVNNFENSSLFKVNFENSGGTFSAKFEDNFEEDTDPSFTANFENLSSTAIQPKETSSNNNVPSEDRYAVFREILEQEKQSDISGAGDDIDESTPTGFDESENLNDIIPNGQSTEESCKFPVVKIDTKITEVISHAKDRYAALRDIILVEDLFDIPKQSQKESNVANINNKNLDILTQKENEHEPENTSLHGEEIEISVETAAKMKQDNHSMTANNVSNADDLEITEHIRIPLSNLSLECQEPMTPVINGSPTVGNVKASQKSSLRDENTSPADRLSEEPRSQLNDMSTSPIREEKSPILKLRISNSPQLQSPLPHSPCEPDLIDSNKPTDTASISDGIGGSSPDIYRAIESRVEQTADVVLMNNSPSTQADSWALFGSGEAKKLSLKDDKHTKYTQNSKIHVLPESPCSSDAKEEWKSENDYKKKWRRGQTSSSSRDMSPWDEDISDQKIDSPDRIDKYDYYMKHARCLNSCDDDYEYDEEILKRRQRRIKGNVTRAKDKFNLETHNRYHASNHHNWSPPEEDGRGHRRLYRNAYERGTYGPPLRDRKTSSYDNRYGKRKYYHEYSGLDYDFDSYTDSTDVKEHNLSYYSDKGRKDYEDLYSEGLECNSRGFKSRELSFERERKNFDPDSVGSYEGTSRQHWFGREEGYGSLDSREEFRERYIGGCDKTNTLRKSVKMRSNKEGEHVRKNSCDFRNLPIPNQRLRNRKSIGSSPWDCEDVVLDQPTYQKISKRPSSASESERRLCESRRVLSHALSGSDGEKDRRVRRRPRIRGAEELSLPKQGFEPFYHGSNKWNIYDFMDCDEFADTVDGLNNRQSDMHQRLKRTDYPQRRKIFANLSFYNEDDDVAPTKYENRLKKNSCFSKIEPKNSLDIFEDQIYMQNDDKEKHRDINLFVHAPQVIADCNKFDYEAQGFESDFNSPTHLPAGVSPIPAKPAFRFSNDFTEKENKLTMGSDNFEQEEQIPAIAPKLRFDDKIIVSKFNYEAASSKFEDDFSTSEFVLEHDDQTSELRKCNNSSRLLPKQRQQDQIKKSESVNIFGRKSEDPFEDDDFFKSSPPALTTDEGENNENTHISNRDIKNKHSTDSLLKWDHNFAKFEENM